MLRVIIGEFDLEINDELLPNLERLWEKEFIRLSDNRFDELYADAELLLVIKVIVDNNGLDLWSTFDSVSKYHKL